MKEQEYLELPWSMEDTVENMRFLKDVVQKIVFKENLHGKGEQDAKEVAFDFDRAIKALERRMPKQPIFKKEFMTAHRCPECKSALSVVQAYCADCGQAIDWREE